VREQSRSLVIGDVFEPQRLERVLRWCAGQVLWQAEELAVVRAVYQDLP
jgi:hypothetical protein